MKQWLSCALALLVVTQLVAAPAPPEKSDPGMTEKKETAPVEVDFSPLAKATAESYKIKFTVTSYDGTRTPMVVNAQGYSPPDGAGRGPLGL